MSVKTRNFTPEDHQEAIVKHLEVLEEKVFQTKTKWPHFSLLIDDLREFAEMLPANATVVSLERTLLYGGYSLIAPLFHSQNFISLDCSPPSAEERGAYNRDMVEDPRFIKVKTTKRVLIEDIDMESGIADLVLIPNLVHHIADQDTMFSELNRLVRPGGQVYIFEPLVRELHQIPDDYLRYTPDGLAKEMLKLGLQPNPPKMQGGPFSAIAYCWTQALQYFPPEVRKEKEAWFYNEHYKELMDWDEEYPKNLFRENTCFPMSFSITAKK